MQFAVAALAVLSFAAGILASTGQGSPAREVYWGAWIGSQFTGTEAPWDMRAVRRFEAVAGKPLSLVMLSQPWLDCSSGCQRYAFPARAMSAIRAHGAVPVMSWGSSVLGGGADQPAMRLAAVAAGAYDPLIRAWAKGARAWGHPFFLRFDWEMNLGCCFPWAEVNGNHPGDFVRAWRHVHDVFASVGATNATWVWCPNVESHGSSRQLAALYPGDRYVDWTGLDGYNWASLQSLPWRGFAALFAPTYRLITRAIAPAKPMMIGETASAGPPARKAAWISGMLDGLPAGFPRVRAFLWFDKTQEADWPLETSSVTRAAFAHGIASHVYAGNRFGSLGASPIPPPTAVGPATAASSGHG